MQSKKLEQLLQSSDSISQCLRYLKQILLNNKLVQNSEIDYLQYFTKAIELKNSYRFLADGIQMNRSLVQVQKQKIQKSKVFLQGLQYYKATLKNQIIQSKLSLTSVKDYIDEQPKEQTNWIQGYKQQQQKIINVLQQMKQKKIKEEQRKIRKQQLKKQIEISQEKYKKTFPQQVKKLYTQVTEASKIFNIKQIDTLQISEFKSKKLETIHSLLYSLKIKGQIDIKHTNLFEIEQLQITIEKGYNQGYEYARQNKIMIEEKPFKFFIASIIKDTEVEKEQLLAISVSRRQDFTTQEIFSNLILQEKVKQIYSNPKSQAERNMNNKYSYLEWLSRILASPSSLINGNQIIQKIKYKMFCLYLAKYAVENVAKKIPSYFFPLFKKNQFTEFHTKCMGFIESKKTFFNKFQKSSFQAYKKDIFIPDWVLKALNSYQIFKQQKNLNGEIDLQSSAYQINKIYKHQLDIFIAKNNLQELQHKDYYLYYKFELMIQKNTLIGYLLIPNDYPAKRSRIRMIDYKKVINTNNEKGQKLSIPQQITLTFEHNQLEIKNLQFTEELDDIQTETNEKVEAFLLQNTTNQQANKNKDTASNKKANLQKIKRKQAFFVYFQINRLVSFAIQKYIENDK